MIEPNEERIYDWASPTAAETRMHKRDASTRGFDLAQIVCNVEPDRTSDNDIPESMCPVLPTR